MPDASLQVVLHEAEPLMRSTTLLTPSRYIELRLVANGLALDSDMRVSCDLLRHLCRSASFPASHHCDFFVNTSRLPIHMLGHCNESKKVSPRQSLYVTNHSRICRSPTRSLCLIKPHINRRTTASMPQTPAVGLTVSSPPSI